MIGVPVAFTPGFVPHFEVSTDPPLELELLDDELDPPPLEAALLLFFELLPQPVSATKPSTAPSAIQTRTDGLRRCVLTVVLLSSKEMNCP
ncbi:MAG TPA: hypothetical protein VGI87_05975 [Solirubrobacteraceae bacterium]